MLDETQTKILLEGFDEALGELEKTLAKVRRDAEALDSLLNYTVPIKDDDVRRYHVHQ